MEAPPEIRTSMTSRGRTRIRKGSLVQKTIVFIFIIGIMLIVALVIVVIPILLLITIIITIDQYVFSTCHEQTRFITTTTSPHSQLEILNFQLGWRTVA